MVYQIVDIDVQDPVLYGEYVERVSTVIRRFGGRYLVRGGKVHSASDDWRPSRIVVIAFDTVDAFRTCYASAEYKELAPLRERSTRSRMVVVEGFEE